MEVQSIQEELSHISQIIAGWCVVGEVPAIERDLVLGKLGRLYEAVRFPKDVKVTEDPEQTITTQDIVADEELDTPIEFDLDDVLAITQDERPQPVEHEEIIAEIQEVEEDEEIQEMENTPAVELPQEIVQEVKPLAEQIAAPRQPALATAPPMPDLFGHEEIEHRRKQRVIMSLYDTTPAGSTPQERRVELEELTLPKKELAETQEEEIEELTMVDIEPTEHFEESSEEEIGEQFETKSEKTEPAEEPEEEKIAYTSSTDRTEISAAGTTILGEVINHDRKTLGDTIRPLYDQTSGVVRTEPVSELRRALGVNDRFLLARDLFGGDAAACDQMLTQLDEFEDLDECMIYITEKYDWNPNSDGAKLLMELIERKLA